VTSGRVVFDGTDITHPTKSCAGGCGGRSRHHLRIRSPRLDPRQKIGEIISEPLEIHRIGTKAERRQRVERLMEQVASTGASRPLPARASGGLRTSVGIATALALEPGS
jgi:peptide/nickel transport system ATP-binding protein